MADPLDEQELLSRFLDRAQRERASGNPGRSSYYSEAVGRALHPAVVWILNRLRNPVLVYGAVALLMCAAAGIGAYRLRDTELSPALSRLNSQMRMWKNQAEVTAAQEKSASQLLQQSQSEREALRKSFAEAQVKYAGLLAQQKTLEAQLATAKARLDQAGPELQAARSGLEEKGRQLGLLEARLQNAIRRAEEQEGIADSLQAKLQSAEQALSRPSSPGATPAFSDTEARNLFGARDLHIVDVYDVESTGKTRRTYGRVYYVEKKLLAFYAFDLQDKQHNRSAVGFQAWGYRQANASKSEDLGLFYVDDASLNRWVLKVNDPRVLDRIDAVFVTLEPPGGSPFPRGRKLLYANLSGPPNHP
ncbi:MAG: hypothetical protein HY234_01580 [Acidobacteria bacterium]|nr:hypothetical protein [Acidobacteriota bacterium]